MELFLYEDGGSDSGIRIIEDNPDVNILQLAHEHITVNDKLNGIPMVAVRNSGREIARIDVTLDRDGKIADISTEIIDMVHYEPSEEIREIPVVKALHEQTISFVQGGVTEEGEPGKPLGTTTAKFQPENEIQGLPEGKLRDTAVMDLILKVQLLYSGADVTACALFKDTSDLPEGDINYGNINEGLLPTPYDKSYNLADYDALVAEAEANRNANVTAEIHESH